MAPGDRLIYYAAGWRRVFAVVEVVSEPTDAVAHTSNPARWPWSVAVEALLVVPHMANAPPVEAIGVAARSMSQRRHGRGQGALRASGGDRGGGGVTKRITERG
jgi:hypothetical protein